MRLSAWLALRCKESTFQRFLMVASETEAIATVRSMCGISSRGEIDRDAGKADLFHRHIRRPYSEFMQSQSNQQPRIRNDH